MAYFRGYCHVFRLTYKHTLHTHTHLLCTNTQYTVTHTFSA